MYSNWLLLIFLFLPALPSYGFRGISYWSHVQDLPLYNSVHTASQCTGAGGTVRDIGGSYLCEFNGATCPGGWARLNNWGTTSPNSCGNCLPCTTGSHAFSNMAAETCMYLQLATACVLPTTCTAITSTVGCY